VFWNSGDEQYIPEPLKPYTYYNLSSEEGYQKLWRRLSGIKKSMLTTYLLILLDLVVLNDSMSLKQRVFTLFFCGNEYAICTKML
jgi:hypothetical protein